MDQLSFFVRMIMLTLASFMLGVTQIESQAVEKLRVRVYYETLCPDSKQFIKSQLYPLLLKGGDQHLDVEFIPYGKATTTRRGSSYSFTCQHGKAECEGNRMHACAIKYLSKPHQFQFIGCSMGKAYPPTTLRQCAAEVGIEAPTRDKISNCASSVEGDMLLAEQGQKTHALQPKLFFVPTVAYNDNGGFHVEKMWQSQNDFQGVVCNELKDVPNFCSGNTDY